MPQTYCARMHVVAKHNGDPRRVVDFTEMNRVSIRQTHSTVKPFDLAVWIPTGAVMSQFDCWNGYHSVPVHKDDVHYLQFITGTVEFIHKCGAHGMVLNPEKFKFVVQET